MNPLLRHTQVFVKRNASTILTCLGGLGVIATGVSAAKSTPKAILLLDVAKEEKGEELTKVEKFKTAAPAYIPAVIIGVSTIACIFGANILDRRQQAALMSAYALLDNSYKEYRDKVKELHGEDADRSIIAEISKDHYEDCDIESVEDGKELFFDFYSMQYFESTMEKVLQAEYNLNRNLTVYGFASLGEFYDELGIGSTPATRSVGWSAEAGGMFYGYSWIDFEHEKVDVGYDGLECWCISFAHDPAPGYNGF